MSLNLSCCLRGLLSQSPDLLIHGLLVATLAIFSPVPCPRARPATEPIYK